jgi:RNA polymerase sigma-70 factor (ECF subfamily)
VNAQPSAQREVLALYDAALPQVYGYLLHRCGSVPLAEDLTTDTFVAALETRNDITVGWLIRVARNKLVDHWRRVAREDRGLHVLAALPEGIEDPWEEQLDALRARAVLGQLSPVHQAALTLRYTDDLPVAEVAHLLDRTLHATEALLVRARAAFRREYGER